MHLLSDGTKPIYVQIAEWIETEILNGNFQPNDKVYSQYKLAEIFTINPATAAKGLNLLSDEKILYSKRGLGKFVTQEARQLILSKRKNHTLRKLLDEVALEATRLQVKEEELQDLLRESVQKIKGEAK